MDRIYAIGHLCRPGSACKRINMFRKDLIDPPKDAILFMQQTRTAQDPCRAHRRDRRIPTKPNNDIGAIQHHLHCGFGSADSNLKRHQKFGQNSAACKRSRPQHLDFDGFGETTHIARTTRVGGQLDPPSQRQQLFGQGLGWKHMPTGAACGQNCQW